MEETVSNTSVQEIPKFRRCFRKRNRRFGWFSVIFALTANLLIFLSVNWVNNRPVEIPAQDLRIIELFEPQLVENESSPLINSSPVNIEIRENPLPDVKPMQLAKTTESNFRPRLIEWVPESLVDQSGISVVAALVDSDNPNFTEKFTPAKSDQTNSHAKVSSPTPLGINQVDNPPRKISGLSPSYPKWARFSRAEGTVTLRFVVGADGYVRNIIVQKVEGDNRFAAVAQKAVKSWRFKPAVDQGTPVDVWGIQKINFKFKGRFK